MTQVVYTVFISLMTLYAGFSGILKQEVKAQVPPPPTIVMVEPTYKTTKAKSGTAKFKVTSDLGIDSVQINGQSAHKEANDLYSLQFPISEGDNKFDLTVKEKIWSTVTQKTFHWNISVPYNIPILEYHHVGYHLTNSLYTQTDLFEAHMKYLRDNGYKSITFAQLNDYLLRGKSLPSKAIIISFDDGYYDVYSNAYPIMKKYGFIGSIAIITGKTEDINKPTRYYLSWEEIKEMDAGGFEMVSHSVNHKHLNEIIDAELTVEVRDSKITLEQKLGKPVKTLIYPYGGVNENVVKKLKDFGYEAGRINVFTNSNYPSKERIYYLPAIGLYKDMDSQKLNKYLTDYQK